MLRNGVFVFGAFAIERVLTAGGVGGEVAQKYFPGGGAVLGRYAVPGEGAEVAEVYYAFGYGVLVFGFFVGLSLRWLGGGGGGGGWRWRGRTGRMLGWRVGFTSEGAGHLESAVWCWHVHFHAVLLFAL